MLKQKNRKKKINVYDTMDNSILLGENNLQVKKKYENKISSTRNGYYCTLRQHANTGYFQERKIRKTKNEVVRRNTKHYKFDEFIKPSLQVQKEGKI